MATSQRRRRIDKRSLYAALTVLVVGLVSAGVWTVATNGTGDTGQAWSPALTLMASPLSALMTYGISQEKPQRAVAVVALFAVGLLLWPLALDGPIGHAARS